MWYQWCRLYRARVSVPNSLQNIRTHCDTVSTHRHHGNVKRGTGKQYGRLEGLPPECYNGRRIRFRISPVSLLQDIDRTHAAFFAGKGRAGAGTMTGNFPHSRGLSIATDTGVIGQISPGDLLDREWETIPTGETPVDLPLSFVWIRPLFIYPWAINTNPWVLRWLMLSSSTLWIPGHSLPNNRFIGLVFS